MSFSNEYTINVDIKKRMSNPVPVFCQGNTAKLNFRIYDNGVLFDLSRYTRSEIVFRLPSGETIINTCSLENGLITYHFTGLEISEIGDITVILSIYSNRTVVSVHQFQIHSYDNMRDEEMNNITILQDLITVVSPLKSEIEILIDENIQLRDDLVEISDETRQLKIDYESLYHETEQSEFERILNENERIQDENIRENSEVVRRNNENSRVLAEEIRINNEVARNITLDKMNVIVDNFDYKGNFNPSTQYTKHNSILYNGSTYVALKTVSNITPSNDGVNWQLIAQRGVDGTGSISKVNNISPDSNGNVTIPNATNNQSGLISPSEKSKLQEIEERATNTVVEDTLTSTSSINAVSAKQAKILKDTIDNVTQKLEQANEILENRIFNQIHVGHQGMPLLAPSNTVPSFELACQYGAQAIETDARVTSDGHIVLYHDDNLNTMTNGNGRPENVTFDYIRSLQFTSGGRFDHYPNTKIATLEEYLQVAVKYDVWCFLEVGSVPVEHLHKVFDLLKKYALLNRTVLLASQGHIAYIRENFSKTIPVCLVTWRVVTESDLNFLETVKPSLMGVAGSAGYLTTEYVQLAHSKGVAINSYVINSYSDYLKQKEWGVDCFTTDFIFGGSK